MHGVRVVGGWIDIVIKIVHIALTAYVTAFNEYNTSLNLHGRALILKQIAGLMVLVRWWSTRFLPSEIYSDTTVKLVQLPPFTASQLFLTRLCTTLFMARNNT